MKQLFNPYDKEYMKMAMLKHEETFREQVYELHRLYRIQKILMKNIQSRRPNGENEEIWNSKNGISLNQINDRHDHIHQKPRQNLDLERPAEDYIADSDGDAVLEIEESEIELTLGPTSYYRRRKAETSLPSDSGMSFSSSSTGSSHTKRTSTSGIHQRTRDEKTRVLPSRRKWGLVQVPDTNPNFLNGRKNTSEVEEKLRQDTLKQSPWLFQVLSLNMT